MDQTVTASQRQDIVSLGIVNWARDNGFPHAERHPPRGALDAGNIRLDPDIIIESKSVAAAATGQPSPSLLERWMAETEVERARAGVSLGVLVVKRRGTTNPARWWAYLPLDALWDVLRVGWSAGPMVPDGAPPVCMEFGALARLLRQRGWGEPIYADPPF